MRVIKRLTVNYDIRRLYRQVFDIRVDPQGSPEMEFIINYIGVIEQVVDLTKFR